MVLLRAFPCYTNTLIGLLHFQGFIGHLGTHRRLCRQPPYNRSHSYIRHHDRARHGRNHALEPGRFLWDYGCFWHLGLRYDTTTNFIIDVHNPKYGCVHANILFKSIIELYSHDNRSKDDVESGVGDCESPRHGGDDLWC